MEIQSLKQLNDQSSSKIIISRINRIIEKYEPVWRVLHEPIQNSIDAIQNRDDIDEGLISISLNLEKQRLSIKDNGKGFPHKEISLLLPDGTDKDDQSDTMGYQGVGLKSIIYSSKNFKLIAKNTKNEVWGVKINNASDYLKNNGSVEAPLNYIYDDLGQVGTYIEVDFDDNLVSNAINSIIEFILDIDTNFKWNWEDIIENNYFLKNTSSKFKFIYLLQYYLLTQSYIGSVNRLLGCRLKQDQEITAKKVILNFEIDFTNVNLDNYHWFFEEVKNDMSAEDNLISFQLENKYIDFQDQAEKIRRYDPRSMPQNSYEFDIPPRGIANDNAILKDNYYCKTLLPNYNIEDDNIEEKYKSYISLLDAGNDSKQYYIRKYKNLFPKILGIYIYINRLDKYELIAGNNFGFKFIAANGIPTQHELTFRSSNQSFYYNPITFILNIDGKLNEGKKELIEGTLVRKCNTFFSDCFENTLNRLTQDFVRVIPHENKIDKTNLCSLEELKVDNIDIKKIPCDENTLIALFYQLLIITKRSLPTYGLLSQSIYDGKFTITTGNITSDSDLLNLEFKVKLSNLLDDFDSNKNPKDVHQCDLIIVWDDNMTNAQQRDWRVVNKETVRNHIGSLQYPNWIKTFLKNFKKKTYTPILVLKDWIIEINTTI